MSSTEKRTKKRGIIKNLFTLFTNYKQIIVVTLTNVSSGQVQDIRRQLQKSNSILVIGKNTVIRKTLDQRIYPLEEGSEFYEDFKGIGQPIPQLENLRKQCKGKIGLIFSNKPAYELKPQIESNKLDTVARVGTFAPNDVVIPAGPTGLDPSQISLFHALKISTKIQKGQIELNKDFQVCFKGVQVTQSQATLLQKLDIKPFKYGMEVLCVYDNGSILTPEIVALSDTDILARFSNGLKNLTALSMQTGIPTQPQVPHLIVNAFKNLAALSFASDYKMPKLEQMQKQAASVTVAAAAPAQQKAAETKKEEKPAEKEEQEEDMDMGGLFDF